MGAKPTPTLPPINFQPLFSTPNNLPSNPMTLFMNWYSASQNSTQYQVMALSTSNGASPQCCAVWLENVTPNGFVFQSPPSTQQALDIQNNQQVSLLFVYENPNTGNYQQVRVEGKASPVPNQNGSGTVLVNRQNMQVTWVYYLVTPTQVSFDYFHPLSPVSVQESVIYQNQRGRWILNPQPFLLIQNQPKN